MKLRKSRGEGRVSSAGPSVALGRRVLQVMHEAYRGLPAGLWGVSRSTDLLSPRGFVLSNNTLRFLKRIVDSNRCPIHSVRLAGRQQQKKFIVPPGVKKIVLDSEHCSQLEFTEEVEELHVLRGNISSVAVLESGLRLASFGNRGPVVTLAAPQKIVIGASMDIPLVVKEGVTELELGSEFNQGVTLPAGLRRLKCGNAFNQPVNLPSSLLDVSFGAEFNRPCRNAVWHLGG